MAPESKVAPVEPKAEGMFPLNSLADTAHMIEERRAALGEVQKQVQKLQDDANRLGGEIALLNSLRSAHGAPPL